MNRRLAASLLDGLGLLLAVASVLAVLYSWDPTRLWLKRQATDAADRYDRVPAALAALPVAGWLKVRDAGAAAETRGLLINRIFGLLQLPADMLPARILRDVDKTPGAHHACLSARGPAAVHLLSRIDAFDARALACEAPFYAGWENLAGIDELTGVMKAGATAYSIGYFRPKRGNGRLILLHAGLGATYHDLHRLIEGWIAQGAAVAAFNMPGHGDNACRDAERHCTGAPLPPPLDGVPAQHFLPPVIAVNHALAQGGITQVAMAGLGAGAWVAAVSAALDARITRSVLVAGVLPEPLLTRRDDGARAVVAGIRDLAGMLDLAVMAADRPGRRQLQVFNRFDACCFEGPRPTLFAALLTKTAADLGGQLAVEFDDSHARHKMSAWARGRIDAFLGGEVVP